jgi:hypothetical protein
MKKLLKEKVMENKNEIKVNKEATITIRLSPEWESYIAATSKALTKKMEITCSKTWVVTRLMSCGLADFEKQHGVERKFTQKKKLA